MRDELHEVPVELRRRIERCRREVAKLGLVLRGSIVERYMACGRQGCRCQAVPPALHGPYYQWTTKIRGKTHTVRLSPSERPLYEEWVAQGRRLDELVNEWREASLEAAELIRKKTRR